MREGKVFRPWMMPSRGAWNNLDIGIAR